MVLGGHLEASENNAFQAIAPIVANTTFDTATAIERCEFVQNKVDTPKSTYIIFPIEMAMFGIVWGIPCSHFRHIHVMPDLKKPFSGGYAWNVPDTAFHGRHVLKCIDVGEKWPVAIHLRSAGNGD